VLIARALRDARSSGSAHLQGELQTSSDRVSYTADLALAAGHERIVLPFATIKVILTGGAGYLRSSTAAGLVQFAGWPAALAKHYAGRWLRYPASNREFTAVTSGLTLSSALDPLAPSGKPVTGASVVLHGHRVTPITGAPAGDATFTKATMYVTQSSDPLPFRVTAVGAGKLSQTLTLSHWGEHVAPRAPNGALAVPRF
jgi:hypothetical protein